MARNSQKQENYTPQDVKENKEYDESKLPAGVKLIKFEDSEYPQQMLPLKGAPKRLFAIGDVSLLNKRAIGVVGSRKCSEYGKQTAMKVGKVAAQNGIVVVSGMASGIDSFAHIGSLKAGGKTIAVLGCGVDVCYPAENKKIYEQITQTGLVISEEEPGTEPMPYMFPARNRIISGLSEAVVVVEANTKSGSLITAELAAQQGRDVFAVPGNITSQYSLGTNKLIMDGARPIAVVDDIFTDMGVNLKASPEELENLGADEAEVYEAVKEKGEVSIDELCFILGKDAFFINGIIAILEIKGLVAYSLGKIFVAKF